MRNPRFVVALIALVLTAAFATPAAAQAQTGTKNLMAGATLVVPGAAFGATVAVEVPWQEMSGGSMSILAGGGYVRSHANNFLFGAGVKYTRKLNEDTRFFLTGIIGVVKGEHSTGFGIMPGGGIIRKLNEKMDFYVSVAPGVIRKFGFGYWGAQLGGGVIMPLK